MSAPSGFRLPGEFERHRATWLLWPTRPDNWRHAAYPAQQQLLAMAALISRFEPVRLGVSREDISRLLPVLRPNITPVVVSFNDAWVRDTGPTILLSGSSAIAIDWKFNSWGGLFDEASSDDKLAGAIARYEDIRCIRAPLVLEGGAIISDGKGTLITTEECVLADNRNPGLTKSDAEEVFREFLNVKKTIWIPFGLVHDEAGGHIDNVCAFAAPDVLLVAHTDDKSNRNYERLRVAEEILRGARNTSGKAFTVVRLPLPMSTAITKEEASGFAVAKGTIKREEGTPLDPSYINFYVTAGAVFLPVFGDGVDEEAIQIVARHFPGREIAACPSREFLLGGGAVHCLTKEIPYF